ncbi:N-acetylmuramoyl-L-alanine amidase [Marininema mesophilum]|uniref:N-acetylmuramoyl-L-alanine amidase n=1 Tax=Marininema mesophilum TaxID=1048340 RepID=A0A1H2V8M6_9BACL|nr:N-acetylmuramoyl-L-alanine amidase [Marininema mesophilum]SDW64691.1 N-acetylmuramoyl-L-alanine amidase [Marininema mesophilum]
MIYLTKLILDPGHGGADSGAVNGSYKEKDFTLTISLKVRDYLQDHYEVTILMTRTTDKTVSLSERTNYANANNGDYFCSIHINSGGGSGWESYIYNGSVSNFTINAQKTIHSTVIEAIHSKYNVKDRGKKEANFHVLREADMPAILLENLFIDTSADLALLRSSTFTDDLAKSIAIGIAKALSLREKNHMVTLYRVIAGSFSYVTGAKSRQAFLEEKGIEAFIIRANVDGNTRYRVQAGAFSHRENAEARLAEVKAIGIDDAYILTD